MPVESAYTSIKQIPATFKQFPLKGTNFDFGGGRFDTTTKWLGERNVKNVVYDPFNRTVEENQEAVNAYLKEQIDSITCCNVLNVIKDASERLNVLEHIKSIANIQYFIFGKSPKIYIQVYEGDKSNIPHPTNAQLNKCAGDYLSEIASVFDEVERTGTKKNIFVI